MINEGVIKAEMGTVGLVSGADGILIFRFEEGGEGLIGYEATAGSLPGDWEGAAQVVQSAGGSVSGRNVYISAQMANNLRESVINLSGVVDATVLDADGNLVNPGFTKAYAEVRADFGSVHLDGAQISAAAAGCADTVSMGCATVVIEAKNQVELNDVEYIADNGGVIDGGQASSIRATSHSAAGEGTKATVLIGADQAIDLVVGEDGDTGLGAFASGDGAAEAEVYIGDYEGDRFLGEDGRDTFSVGENLNNGESAPDVTLSGSTSSFAIGGEAVRASFEVKGDAVDFTENATLAMLAAKRGLSNGFDSTVNAVAEFRAEDDLTLSGGVNVIVLGSGDMGSSSRGSVAGDARVTADSEAGDVDISGAVTVQSTVTANAPSASGSSDSSSRPYLGGQSYARFGVSAGGGVALSGPVKVGAQATADGSRDSLALWVDAEAVVEVEADAAVVITDDITVSATARDSVGTYNSADAEALLRVDGQSVSVSGESELSVVADGRATRGEESYAFAESDAEIISEEGITFAGTLTVQADAEGNSTSGASASSGDYWAPVMAEAGIVLDGQTVGITGEGALTADANARNLSADESAAAIADAEVEVLGEETVAVGEDVEVSVSAYGGAVGDVMSHAVFTARAEEGELAYDGALDVYAEHSSGARGFFDGEGVTQGLAEANFISPQAIRISGGEVHVSAVQYQEGDVEALLNLYGGVSEEGSSAQAYAPSALVALDGDVEVGAVAYGETATATAELNILGNEVGVGASEAAAPSRVEVTADAVSDAAATVYVMGSAPVPSGEDEGDETVVEPADQITYHGDLLVRADSVGSAPNAYAEVEFVAGVIDIDAGNGGFDVTANANGGTELIEGETVTLAAEEAHAGAYFTLGSRQVLESEGRHEESRTADSIDFTGELQVAANASGSGSASATASAEFYAREISVNTGEQGFDVSAGANGGISFEDGQQVIVGGYDASADAVIIFGADSNAEIDLPYGGTLWRTDNTAENIDFTGELQVAANASGSGSVSASAAADFFGFDITVDTGERGFDVRATADGGTGIEEGQSLVYAASKAEARAEVNFRADYTDSSGGSGDGYGGMWRSSDDTADSIDFTGELQVAANASGSSAATARATADFYAQAITVETAGQGIDVGATADGGTGVEAGQSRVYAAESAEAEAWAIFGAYSDAWQTDAIDGDWSTRERTADSIDFTGELQVAANASGSSSATARATADFYARAITVETAGQGIDVSATADGGTRMEEGYEVIRSADEANAEAEVLFGAYYQRSSFGGDTVVVDNTADSIDFTGELQMTSYASGNSAANADASADFYAREITVETAGQGIDVSVMADGGTAMDEGQKVIRSADQADADAWVAFYAYDFEQVFDAYGGSAYTQDATADSIDFTGELQVAANASGSGEANARATADFYARAITVETAGQGIDVSATADGGTHMEEGYEVIRNADAADAEAKVAFQAHYSAGDSNAGGGRSLSDHTADSIDFTGDLQVAANASGSSSASAGATAEFYAREISVNTGEQGID
ncbi:MAG: hypothetical protein B0D88_08195, partial [Candidatus Sedimenticola endophacoides]